MFEIIIGAILILFGYFVGRAVKKYPYEPDELDEVFRQQIIDAYLESIRHLVSENKKLIWKNAVMKILLEKAREAIFWMSGAFDGDNEGWRKVVLPVIRKIDNYFNIIEGKENDR